MGRFIDLTSQKFGRLIVVERAGRRNGRTRWKCKCACGKNVIVDAYCLKSANTQSCGCLHRDLCIARSTKHGMARTPTYRSWWAMRQRCRHKSQSSYPNYGGRGILICERWDKFSAFLADMGQRPYGHTLDRIDNFGNYEPGNCKWSTRLQQASNTRRNFNITFNGQTLTCSEWERRLGAGAGTLKSRLYRGWPLEKAMRFHAHVPDAETTTLGRAACT